MTNDDFFQKNKLFHSAVDLFEELPGFLYFVKDASLRLVAVNTRLAEKIDVSDQRSILGMTDYDYLPAHMADAYKEDDEWILANNKAIKNKVELVTRGNGLVDWSTTTKTPLRDPEGNVCGIMGVTRPFETGVTGIQTNEELGRAIELMQTKFYENISVKTLAETVFLSVSSFERKFKKAFKMTPKQYMRHLRVQEACHKLVQTTDPLAVISGDCGFADQSHFSREFLRIMNESPKHYRSRYRS